MKIDALFSDELYSRERQLEKELADIRQQIKQRQAEGHKGNIGKYFRFKSSSENDIECYKGCNLLASIEGLYQVLVIMA